MNEATLHTDEFAPPTPEQETQAEAVMTNEQKVASNTLYDILKPFRKIEIPQEEKEIIGKNAQRVAELAGKEYKENAEKVENSPGMKVLGALKKLEAIEEYRGVFSVAAEAIRDAARTWAAELATAEKIADTVDETFDEIGFVESHRGHSIGQMNSRVELFSMRTHANQIVPPGEDVAQDANIMDLISRALKTTGKDETFSDIVISGGDLGKKSDNYELMTYLYVYKGSYDSPSSVYLRVAPKDMVSLVEALKAEK